MIKYLFVISSSISSLYLQVSYTTTRQIILQYNLFYVYQLLMMMSNSAIFNFRFISLYLHVTRFFLNMRNITPGADPSLTMNKWPTKTNICCDIFNRKLTALPLLVLTSSQINEHGFNIRNTQLIFVFSPQLLRFHRMSFCQLNCLENYRPMGSMAGTQQLVMSKLVLITLLWDAFLLLPSCLFSPARSLCG